MVSLDSSLRLLAIAWVVAALAGPQAQAAETVTRTEAEDVGSVIDVLEATIPEDVRRTVSGAAETAAAAAAAAAAADATSDAVELGVAEVTKALNATVAAMAPSVAADSSAAGIVNAPGLALAAALAEATPSEPVVVSPYSVVSALMILAQGAAGDTAAAFSGFFGTGETALTESGAALARLDAQLSTSDGDEVLSANGLWAHPRVRFRNDFVAQVTGTFGARIETADLSLTETRQAINAWVAEHTKDKIDSIIPESGGDLAAVILNALYFHGSWQRPFDPAATADGTFHNADGSDATVPMMRGDGSYAYLAADSFRAVRLPYEGDVTMVLVLPAEGETPATVLAQAAAYGSWLDQSAYASSPGIVTVPRFSLDYAAELKHVLAGLGLAPALAEDADYSGMVAAGGRLVVSSVLHKIALDVDEAGTTAAAATAVLLSRAFHRPGFTLAFDRPFVLALQHVDSGALLFVGQITRLGTANG